MMRVMLVLLLVAAQTVAEPQRAPNPPLKVDAATLQELAPEVQRVVVTADIGKKAENPQWMLSFTAVQVLLGKLQEENPPPPVNPEVLAKAKQPEPAYRGLKVQMTLVDGREFEVLKVFKGRITAPGGATVREDVGRGLEYWLFSTARVQRDVALGASLLPVLAFEQCRLLGMMVVQTTPRQCVLPDETLLVQTDKPADMSTLKVKDFDSCLKHGVALIASFPRRCVAAGGKVFAEPPRVAEPPADAPMAAGAENRFAMPVSASGVVPEVSSTIVTNPLLGGYVVSGSADVSTGVVSASVPMVTLGGVSASGAVSAGMPVSTSATEVSLPDIAPAAGPESLEEPGWGERLLRWLGIE